MVDLSLVLADWELPPPVALRRVWGSLSGWSWRLRGSKLGVVGRWATRREQEEEEKKAAKVLVREAGNGLPSRGGAFALGE